MKKRKVNDTASQATKNVGLAVDKAKKTIVQTLDQNGDGRLDMKDVVAFANAVKEIGDSSRNAIVGAAQEQSGRLSAYASEVMREHEKKSLAPVFFDDVAKPNGALPKMIRITEIDKKHEESDLCQGAIGHKSMPKELEMLNIYRERMDTAQQFPISFLPNLGNEIYYVDPAYPQRYIALDTYFEYLKQARVAELQQIAQALGAKHFRVTYKEQKKTITKAKAKGRVGAKNVAGVTADHQLSSDDFSSISIAAEMNFLGHEPNEPELHYFKGNPQIVELVKSRMKPNPVLHQSYILQLSESSGIRIKDALKIDATLNAIKCEGNATFSSELQDETRRSLEYEIDF